MKTAGIVATAIGGLLTLSSLQLAVTKYDLSSSHDLSQCLGGLGFSVLILAVGITMWLKSSAAEKRRVAACRRKQRNSSGAATRRSC